MTARGASLAVSVVGHGRRSRGARDGQVAVVAFVGAASERLTVKAGPVGAHGGPGHRGRRA